MKEKVLDIIYHKHTEGKEKTVFLKDFILKKEKGGFNEDIFSMLDFFYKHIPLHFAYEETVINELLKSKALTKDEALCLNKILSEHKMLLADFENIKETAEKSAKAGKGQREEFMALVNEAIHALIAHADFEDKYLYPLADAKADDKVLGAVKKAISRIVY